MAGINGGFFEADFTPSGLLLIDGKVISKPVEKPPLTAIVGVTGDGSVRVQEAADGVDGFVSAFQAGPFLIDPDGGIGIRQSDGRRLKRSVIAISRDRSLLLIQTSDATLAEVAQWLHGQSGQSGFPEIVRAANCDGGPSSGFFAALGEAVVSIPETGPIRSALLVHPRP
jgi:hypothetical protein